MPFDTTPRISRAVERVGRGRGRARRAAPTARGRRDACCGRRRRARISPSACGSARRTACRSSDGRAPRAPRRRRRRRGRPTDRAIPSTLTPRRLSSSASSSAGRSVGHELAEPRDRDLHATPPNCSRNRTSPSINIRMSGIAVPEHGHPFDPEPEREPGVPLAVVPAVLQDLRMHHAGAEQLDPAVAADPAPDAVADEARHADLGARLHEREVRRAEPHPTSLAEQRPREHLERALEVGERDALVDDEALDLVEDRQVRRVGRLPAEDPAGRHDVHRRRLRSASCGSGPPTSRCAAAARMPGDRRRTGSPSSCGPDDRAGCSAPGSCASRPRSRVPRPPEPQPQ